MDILIHDLDAARFSALLPELPEGLRVIGDTGALKPCTGCFGCWVKTPGQCVIKDGYEELGKWLAMAERVTVISRFCFGGYSPFVKNIFDRSISYMLPFFERKEGLTHHCPRYGRSFRLRVHFYGEVNDEARETALALVKANALNFHASTHKVTFSQTVGQLTKEVLA